MRRQGSLTAIWIFPCADPALKFIKLYSLVSSRRRDGEKTLWDSFKLSILRPLPLAGFSKLMDSAREAHKFAAIAIIPRFFPHSRARHQLGWRRRDVAAGAPGYPHPLPEGAHRHPGAALGGGSVRTRALRRSGDPLNYRPRRERPRRQIAHRGDAAQGAIRLRDTVPERL